MSSPSCLPDPVWSALGRRVSPPTIERLMTAALQTPGLLSLAAGFTDTGSLPIAALQSAMRKLSERSGAPEFLQYGMNQGRPGLRRRLAEELAREESGGLDARELETQLFVTNGSQQALYLAVQTLCDPGDLLLVDRPSYFVFLEMLRGLGVQPLSIPTDRSGRIDAPALAALLDRLERTGQRERLKGVYFVSYFSNPSARSLSIGEKRSVAEALARRELFLPIIEDAAYRLLYFNSPHAAPGILAMPEYADFPRLYTSTLTKPFATGLKVGYGCCTDAAWRAKMLHVKGHHDFGTAHFPQAVLEEVLAAGGLEAFLPELRTLYAAKMRALHEALLDGGLRARGWRWEEPAGGLYLWLEAPAPVDTRMDSAFCRRCLETGVLYVPGDLCFGDEAPANFVRLSYGVLGPDELRAAAQRFLQVAREFS